MESVPTIQQLSSYGKASIFNDDISMSNYDYCKADFRIRFF
jgi:hypothetical protein